MKKFKFCPLCSTPLQEAWLEERQRQFCPACEYVHYINPIPATAIIGIKDQQILLIKRGMEPGKGIWTLPSGFMEASETPEEGCLRELKEETGMSGEIVYLSDVFHEYSNMYGDILNLFYYVKLNDEIPVAGDDAEDVALIPMEQIKDLGFRCFNQAYTNFKERFTKD